MQEMTETRDLLARLEFRAGGSRPTTPAKAGSEPDDEPADSPARQTHVAAAARAGRMTNCRKSTQEVLGLADAFDDIRKQLINNRIDTEELKNRLQAGIADPLRAIADAMFPELERRLEALQAALDDAGAGPGLRDRAQQQADDILLAMRKVLDRMIELEDFNQAVDCCGTSSRCRTTPRADPAAAQKKIRDLLKE